MKTRATKGGCEVEKSETASTFRLLRCRSRSRGITASQFAKTQNTKYVCSTPMGQKRVTNLLIQGKFVACWVEGF